MKTEILQVLKVSKAKLYKVMMIVDVSLCTGPRLLAISYPNGIIVNIAKIDALPSYKDMIFRLSLSSSEHLHYRPLTGTEILSIS